MRVYSRDKAEERKSVMYQIKPIGKVKAGDEKTLIVINKDYQKALMGLEYFSHIHIFFITKNSGLGILKKSIVKVEEIHESKGYILSSTYLNIPGEAELIDIKPYFPCEDTIKEPVSVLKQLDHKILVEQIQDSYNFSIPSVGVIRNVSGSNYIQLDKGININGKYIIIFWWFHKFDTDLYRRNTLCNPPYENAKRCGVFATRSPVRPNPLAMTVARVIKVDEENKRIYINGIESFDQTPCLGIWEYDSREHTVTNPMVPKWLSHWPKYIDESVHSREASPIELKDSGWMNLISAEDNYRNSRRRKKLEASVYGREQKEILVYGARENNLKGIDVRIPYGKITAVVGVSGSGKSSLVNNTIYAECRRRMEYLSHNHGIFQYPKVDEIIGCIPAVVITQNAIQGNSFSTVGTYTGVYDYLRNIYGNVAIRHCPNCGNAIFSMSRERILSILKSKQKIEIFSLSNERIVNASLEDKVGIALERGEGAFYAEIDDKDRVLLQIREKCYYCDKILFKMTPATFSYLDSDGRCPVCNGTGKVIRVDEHKVIEHPEWSLLEGASSFYGKLKYFRDNSNANWMKGQVFGLADAMKVDLKKPWCELPEAYKEAILHGLQKEVTFRFHNKKNGRKGEIKRQVEGLIPIIERRYEESSTTNAMEKYMTKITCNSCNGERLAREGRMASIHNVRYPEAAKMTFYELKEFCNTLIDILKDEEYTKTEYAIYALLEIAKTAIQLGIGYLPLSQETSTLSGGEGQRLKLLGAFKNHLSGILYIFDEPSKGLHPRDYQNIIDLMKALVKEGNTIIMVEHNEDMIRIADNIIELGPGAGKQGGMLIGQGTVKAMLHHPGSQISKYMKDPVRIPTVRKRLSPAKQEFIQLKNLNYNNLKNISVNFPKQALTCICGVSGSGKSSLMKGEIYKRTQKGKEFSKVILVDQMPIGKTSKSIVATYIGVMDGIRREFSNMPEAIKNGWDEKYFSFNNEYGQCDTCMGEGRIRVKYTEGTLVECPDCKGKRYKKRILSVLYREKSIDELLAMTVNEAISFLSDLEELVLGLISLKKVGLGYLKLGQGTSTLSGGEGARLKLAKELISKKSSDVLYLLDEPTTGLHFSDIEHLLKLIDELICNGNTVIAIEHNKQFMLYCDYIIELGPGAGKDGGYVIHQGRI